MDGGRDEAINITSFLWEGSLQSLPGLQLPDIYRKNLSDGLLQPELVVDGYVYKISRAVLGT